LKNTYEKSISVKTRTMPKYDDVIFHIQNIFVELQIKHTVLFLLGEKKTILKCCKVNEEKLDENSARPKHIPYKSLRCFA
jgi:hypothetical protein